jgi:hypothetical protein
MPDYQCSRCQKVFPHKGTYERHVNRKFPCKIVGEIVRFACEFCDKTYTTKSNLNRHLKACKSKQNSEIEQRIDNMERKIEKLEIENKQLVVQNNVTNINNTINIVAYGKEDISRLTNKDFRAIMRRGMLSVPELVKRIHFDEKCPENHNVYISNLRGKYGQIHDDNKWRLVDIKELLQQVFGDHYDILITKFKELMGIDFLDDITVEKFRTFLNSVNSDREQDIEDEQVSQSNRYVEMVKEDLKKILYENRDVVEKTKKLVS